jgi:hypothetical protein
MRARSSAAARPRLVVLGERDHAGPQPLLARRDVGAPRRVLGLEERGLLPPRGERAARRSEPERGGRAVGGDLGLALRGAEPQRLHPSVRVER